MAEAAPESGGVLLEPTVGERGDVVEEGTGVRADELHSVKTVGRGDAHRGEGGENGRPAVGPNQEVNVDYAIKDAAGRGGERG